MEKYESYLINEIDKFEKLPVLSVEDIDKNIRDDFRPILKLVYKHIDIKTLSHKELMQILKFGKSYTDIMLLMANFGHIEYFDYLVSIGFDKDCIGKSGKNAFLFASMAGKIEMVDYLLSLGFDKNYATPSGFNALLGASSWGHIQMFDHLVSLGLDKNHADKFGINALLCASDGGQIEMFKHLLSLGYDKNYTTPEGYNAFHYAVSPSGNIECVKYLLNIGYDLNFEDNIGRNALTHALNVNKDEIAMYLIRRGISVKDNDIPRAALFQRRIYVSKVNVTAFRALVCLMMGYIRHRYWSPDGKGYYRSQQRFNNMLVLDN